MERMELPTGRLLGCDRPCGRNALRGTEPSRLFVLRDGAEWTNLRRYRTSPPASAGASRPGHGPITSAGSRRTRIGGSGCCRHRAGGVMLSEDGARASATTVPARSATLTRSPGTTRGRTAYEAAGDGAAWSVDGGRSWSALDAGRELGYCWALAADPDDPTAWYVSARPDLVRHTPPGERTGALPLGRGRLRRAARARRVDAVHARRPGRRARLRHGRRRSSAAPIAARAGSNSP